MKNSSTDLNLAVRRFLAYLIDLVICLMFFWAYAALFYKKIGIRSYRTVGIPPMIVIPVIMFIYYCVQEFLFQRTIAKYLFGLKVVKIDNSELNLTDLIKRHLFDFIELLLFPVVIPLVLELINKNQQRFGDILANTRVERINKDQEA
jgi:uncharacterized RDD family membrane protein YckC